MAIQDNGNVCNFGEIPISSGIQYQYSILCCAKFDRPNDRESAPPYIAQQKAEHSNLGQEGLKLTVPQPAKWDRTEV